MATIISDQSYKGIDDVDVSGKRVLVRADLNVPLAERPRLRMQRASSGCCRR